MTQMVGVEDQLETVGGAPQRSAADTGVVDQQVQRLPP
jgi:hypothetical protein